MMRRTLVALTILCVLSSVGLIPASVQAAEVFTDIGTNAVNSPGTSYTPSTSITANAGELIFACVVQEFTSTPNVPTITASPSGLTFAQVTTSNNSLIRTTLFRAMSTGAASGQLTFDFGGQGPTGVAWSYTKVTGVNTGGTQGSAAVVQSGQANCSACTTLSSPITLAAFASATNGTFMCAGSNNNNVFTLDTTPAGWTKSGESVTATCRVVSAYVLANDTSVNLTVASNQMGVIAAEIGEAVTTPTRRHLTPRYYNSLWDSWPRLVDLFRFPLGGQVQ